MEKNKTCIILSSKSFSIIDIVNLFFDNIRYLKLRSDERFESRVLKSIRGIKIKNLKSKINIKDYITEFVKKRL